MSWRRLRRSDVVERPYTVGGGGATLPPSPPPPLPMCEADSQILNLSFKNFGPPSAGTKGGPWEEEGPSQPPLSDTSLLQPLKIWTLLPGRDASEAKGPQRRPQRRVDRRLEEVAEAVGGGYCRLQMPLKLALAVKGTVAGHRLGALGGGGGAKQPDGMSHRGANLPPFQCIPAPRFLRYTMPPKWGWQNSPTPARPCTSDPSGAGAPPLPSGASPGARVAAA